MMTINTDAEQRTALVEAFAVLTDGEQEQLGSLCRRLGRQERG